jgi:hypothetical protein
VYPGARVATPWDAATYERQECRSTLLLVDESSNPKGTGDSRSIVQWTNWRRARVAVTNRSPCALSTKAEVASRAAGSRTARRRRGTRPARRRGTSVAELTTAVADQLHHRRCRLEWASAMPVIRGYQMGLRPCRDGRSVPSGMAGPALHRRDHRFRKESDARELKALGAESYT